MLMLHNLTLWSKEFKFSFDRFSEKYVIFTLQHSLIQIKFYVDHTSGEFSSY